MCNNYFFSSSWQEEEEDQAAASHPTPLQVEASSSYSSLPRYHRLRRSQGRFSRKNSFCYERRQSHQKTLGKGRSGLWWRRHQLFIPSPS